MQITCCILFGTFVVVAGGHVMFEIGRRSDGGRRHWATHKGGEQKRKMGCPYQHLLELLRNISCTVRNVHVAKYEHKL